MQTGLINARKSFNNGFATEAAADAAPQKPALTVLLYALRAVPVSFHLSNVDDLTGVISIMRTDPRNG